MSARKPGSQFAAVGGRYVLAKHSLVMMYQENFLLSQCIYKTFSSQDIPARLYLVRMYQQNVLLSQCIRKVSLVRIYWQNTLLSGCTGKMFSCNNVSAKCPLVWMSQQNVLLSECTGETFLCMSFHWGKRSCAYSYITKREYKNKEFKEVVY